MNIHEGHRERLKKRFLDHGLENFDDINSLELLLFYAVPRRDTNALAHALIERFGSLGGVMEASEDELRAVEGVGENAVTLLRLVPALCRRYIQTKTSEAAPVDTPTLAGLYFVPIFLFRREESIQALLLDARMRPICCEEVGQGVVDAAQICARRLAELCVDHRASSVIVAHNHPSGVAMPSAEDELFTMGLSRALSLLGVELRDHIIVAGNEFVSMRETGLM